jgi:hypothetical protein
MGEKFYKIELRQFEVGPHQCPALFLGAEGRDGQGDR